ncbi:MAG: TolC family protein, partial [Bacteroidota bacterium]
FFNKPNQIKTSQTYKLLVSIILLAVMSYQTNFQNTHKSLDELMTIALENNAGLNASRLKVSQSELLVKSAFDFDKTEIYYQYDENNLAINDRPIGVFGIQQDFEFPTVYSAKKRVNKALVDLQTTNLSINEKSIRQNVVSSYHKYLYAKEKVTIYTQLDSLYFDFARIAKRRFELGETNYLEKITAHSKQRQVHVNLEQAQQELKIAFENLSKVVQYKDSLIIQDATINKVPLNIIDLNTSPEVISFNKQQDLLEARLRLEKQKLWPDLSLNYFQGSNSTLNQNLYGYQFGLKIPLLFGAQNSKIKASKMAIDISNEEAQDYKIQLHTKFETLQSQLIQNQKALEYYENEGLILANEILKTANVSFKNGEIDFYQYIISIENAYDIQLKHLEHLNSYNQTVINLNYLTL